MCAGFGREHPVVAAEPPPMQPAVAT
jgi:PadR family transcriptional regulator AphA